MVHFFDNWYSDGSDDRNRQPPGGAGKDFSGEEGMSMLKFFKKAAIIAFLVMLVMGLFGPNMAINQQRYARMLIGTIIQDYANEFWQTFHNDVHMMPMHTDRVRQTRRVSDAQLQVRTLVGGLQEYIDRHQGFFTNNRWDRPPYPSFMPMLEARRLRFQSVFQRTTAEFERELFGIHMDENNYFLQRGIVFMDHFFTNLPLRAWRGDVVMIRAVHRSMLGNPIHPDENEDRDEEEREDESERGQAEQAEAEQAEAEQAEAEQAEAVDPETESDSEDEADDVIVVGESFVINAPAARSSAPGIQSVELNYDEDDEHDEEAEEPADAEEESEEESEAEAEDEEAEDEEAEDEEAEDEEAEDDKEESELAEAVPAMSMAPMALREAEERRRRIAALMEAHERAAEIVEDVEPARADVSEDKADESEDKADESEDKADESEDKADESEDKADEVEDEVEGQGAELGAGLLNNSLESAESLEFNPPGYVRRNKPVADEEDAAAEEEEDEPEKEEDEPEEEEDEPEEEEDEPEEEEDEPGDAGSEPEDPPPEDGGGEPEDRGVQPEEPDERGDDDAGGGAASAGSGDAENNNIPVNIRTRKPINQRLQLKKLIGKLPLFSPGGAGYDPLSHAQQAALRLSLEDQLREQRNAVRLVKKIFFKRVAGSRLTRLTTNERVAHDAAADAQPALIAAVGRRRGRVSRQQNARQQALQQLPRGSRFLRHDGRLQRLNTGERADVDAAADSRMLASPAAQSPMVISPGPRVRQSPMVISPLVVDFSQDPV
jgi:hypothetical protein